MRKLLSPKDEAERMVTRSYHAPVNTHDLVKAELRIELMLLVLLEEMEKIMATQKELVDQLTAVLAQQKKTGDEIKSVQASVDALNAKITELEAIIATGGTVTPELEAAVAAVKAQAQVVDDQIPDLPTPPPVAPTTAPA